MTNKKKKQKKRLSSNFIPATADTTAPTAPTATTTPQHSTPEWGSSGARAMRCNGAGCGDGGWAARCVIEQHGGDDFQFTETGGIAHFAQGGECYLEHAASAAPIDQNRHATVAAPLRHWLTGKTPSWTHESLTGSVGVVVRSGVAHGHSERQALAPHCA